jgi:hypothetical protein
MSEEMKAKIRHVIDEAWNKSNLDARDEIYASNYVVHRFPFPDINASILEVTCLRKWPKRKSGLVAATHSSATHDKPTGS